MLHFLLALCFFTAILLFNNNFVDTFQLDTLPLLHPQHDIQRDIKQSQTMDIQHLIPSELSGDGQTFDTIRNDHGALREYREYDQIHIDALSTSRNGSMLYPEYVDLSAYHSQVIQEPPQKEDNELRNAAAHGFNRGQSIQDTISITIIDSEGPRIYFQKSYRLGTKTSIKKALDQIRSHVCTTCSSNPQLLEFWYETTKVSHHSHSLTKDDT